MENFKQLLKIESNLNNITRNSSVYLIEIDKIKTMTNLKKTFLVSIVNKTVKCLPNIQTLRAINKTEFYRKVIKLRGIQKHS